MSILFSVLIPAIFERLDDLKALSTELQRQITESKRDDVEVISVVDNCVVSIGRKREAVLRASHGEHVAYLDDDDWAAPTYIAEITAALDSHPAIDVITFNSHAYINSDKAAEVIMRLGSLNEQYNSTRFKRAAWHTCAWRAELAKQFSFPDSSYGEDWAWAKQCNEAAKTEHHLDSFLHIYRFSSDKTRAKA